MKAYLAISSRRAPSAELPRIAVTYAGRSDSANAIDGHPMQGYRDLAAALSAL